MIRAINGLHTSKGTINALFLRMKKAEIRTFLGVQFFAKVIIVAEYESAGKRGWAVEGQVIIRRWYFPACDPAELEVMAIRKLHETKELNPIEN